MSVTLSSDFVVINYQAQTISQVSVVSLGNKSSPPQLHQITFKKLLFSSVFLSEVLGDSARTAVERKYSFSAFSWHQGTKLWIYLLGPSLSLSRSNSCCYRIFVHRYIAIDKMRSSSKWHWGELIQSPFCSMFGNLVHISNIYFSSLIWAQTIF